MQPGTIHFDLEALLAVWQKFRTDNTIPPEAVVDPLVLTSWQRCVPRMNPVGAPHWVSVRADVLPSTLNQNAALLAIARPIMEDVHQFIEGSQALLILVDKANCILELLGDREMLTFAKQLGMEQGVYLSEGHIGTNAWAMALMESSPVQVVGPEHF